MNKSTEYSNAQGQKEGKHYPGYCTSETVRKSSEGKESTKKDKARAFHTCKMNLAKQVAGMKVACGRNFFFRSSDCVILQQSSQVGNCCIVITEVHRQFSNILTT